MTGCGNEKLMTDILITETELLEFLATLRHLPQDRYFHVNSLDKSNPNLRANSLVRH